VQEPEVDSSALARTPHRVLAYLKATGRRLGEVLVDALLASRIEGGASAPQRRFRG
jgi:hypothetical protein